MARVTFEKFLANRSIPKQDGIVPLLRELWNQAIETASEHFIKTEGTDYDLQEDFAVPDNGESRANMTEDELELEAFQEFADILN